MYAIASPLTFKENISFSAIANKEKNVLIASRLVEGQKDYATGQLNITENSRTIHHYVATWLTWAQRMEKSSGIS